MHLDFRRQQFVKVAKVLDLSAIAFVLFAATAISSGSLGLPTLAYLLVIRIKVANLFLLMGFLGLSLAVMSGCGFYRSHRLSSFAQRLNEALLASSLITISIFALRWPVRLDFASNSFLVVFWVLGFFVLGGTREVAQRVLYYVRARGENLRNVVIVGEGEDVVQLAELMQEPSLGYRVVGLVDAKQVISEPKEAGKHERIASAM